jgi:hypothetical protein
MKKSIFSILFLSFLLFYLPFPMTVFAQKKQEINLITPNDRLEVRKFKTIKDGKYIVLATNTDKIQIWEAASGKLIKEFKEAYGSDFNIAPDGNTLGLISISQSAILLFDFENFVITDSIKRPVDNKLGGINSFAFSPNGKEMYINVFNIEDPVQYVIEYSIYTVDIKTNSAKLFANCKDGNQRLEVSPDGNWLLHKSMIFPKDNILYNTKTGIALKTENIRGFTADGKLYGLKYDKTDPNYKTYTAFIFNPNTNSNDVQFNFSYTSKEIGNYKDDVWLDENRLLISFEHTFSIIDFKEKKTTPLTVYSDEFMSDIVIVDFTIAKKENGKVKTLYRCVTRPANKILEWDLEENKIVRKIGNAIDFSLSPTVAENDYKFQIGEKEIQLGQRINSYNYTIKNDEVIAYSPNGETKVHAGRDLTLENFKSLDEVGQPTNTIKYQDEYYAEHAQGFAYSSDNKLVAYIWQGGFYIIETATLKKISEVKTGGSETAIYSSQNIGCFVENNKKLIAQGRFANGEVYTYCTDIKTNTILWKIKKELVAFTPTPEGILCLEVLYDLYKIAEMQTFISKIYWLNPTTGEIKKTQEISVGLVPKSPCFTKDGKQLIFGSGSNLCFYDIAKNELIRIIKKNAYYYTNVSFFQHNPNFALSFNANGDIIFWDAFKKIELAKLFFYGTNDWVCVTPDGRFDASTNAMKEIYYTQGKEIIALDNLYESYYTPQLIARLIAKEQFEPVPDINNLKIKPTAKMLYEQKSRNLNVEDDITTYTSTTGIAEITINATAPDDAIDEIRLFHNGKIVTLTTRNLIVSDDIKNNTTSKKYTINLLNGSNTFRAVALNTQRTESKPDEIMVNYQAPNQPNNNTPNNNTSNNTVGTIDLVDKNATLHLVVVGINKYQNEKLSLNYALADATAFKNEIEKDAKTVLAQVKTYLITDNAADKKGITDALNEVQKTAKAQDVFLFYYAGHGVISEKNKEFYLVPTDVSDLKNIDAVLEQKGIAAKLLQAYAINIQAQKQLFILDACQSAGAFEQLMSNDGNQQKNIGVVARATGTHWMAASGAQQFANEFASLGHGVFTYVLLEALKGQAAANQMITVNNLKIYLQKSVPELMKKYNGTPQYPSSYGFGNDFPIGVVKN